jgi:hypothetical protein
MGGGEHEKRASSHGLEVIAPATWLQESSKTASVHGGLVSAARKGRRGMELTAFTGGGIIAKISNPKADEGRKKSIYGDTMRRTW